MIWFETNKYLNVKNDKTREGQKNDDKAINYV